MCGDLLQHLLPDRIDIVGQLPQWHGMALRPLDQGLVGLGQHGHAGHGGTLGIHQPLQVFKKGADAVIVLRQLVQPAGTLAQQTVGLRQDDAGELGAIEGLDLARLEDAL